jgi:molecular chaperone HtpG
MAKSTGKNFGTDTTKILEILTHRLYSESDIFLKELISNCSDACNKINFLMTSGEYQGDNYKKKIFIDTNEENHILTIIDNGIGMNNQDMEKFLGTIASSNTRNTIEQIKDKTDLIGQFGIGFYSCFMVADEVKVWSKKYDSNKSYLWTSNGKESYTIEESNQQLVKMEENHGTQVQLHLKEDFYHFTNKYSIREIIKKYSNYISIPIMFYDEQDKNESINEGIIPWRVSTLSQEVAKNIYKNMLGGMGEIFSYFHQKLQGRYDYTRLIFIPSKSFFIPITRDHKPMINIYLNGVFVCNDESFLPLYLRFIKGLIEFEDLPINISRENFLQNPFVQQTKKSVKHKILEELINNCENNRNQYIENFWDVYGNILKEGIIEDYEDKTMIIDSCLFKSAKSNQLITVKEYVENHKDIEDNNIYYFLHKNSGSHPMVESFITKHNKDVLILKDELEKICFENAYNYDGKNFVSITEKKEQHQSSDEEKAVMDNMKTYLHKINFIEGNILDKNIIGFIIKEQNFMNFNVESKTSLTLNTQHPLFQKALLYKDNPQQLKEITLAMINFIDMRDNADNENHIIIDKIINSYVNSL